MPDNTSPHMHLLRAALGDRVLWASIALAALASVVLGLQFVQSGEAFGVTAALL